MRRAAIGAIAGILMSAATVALFAASQTSPARSSDDTLAALLVEVKGLRAAIEQLAGAGAQVQLSVARLQMEEARLNTMIRRLNDIHDRLASAQLDLTDLSAQQERSERALSDNTFTPSERDVITQSLANTKRQAVRKQADVSRLTADEAQLAADIATSQARWTEFSRRLDELDRALAKK